MMDDVLELVSPLPAASPAALMLVNVVATGLTGRTADAARLIEDALGIELLDPAAAVQVLAILQTLTGIAAKATERRQVVVPPSRLSDRPVDDILEGFYPT